MPEWIKPGLGVQELLQKWPWAEVRTGHRGTTGRNLASIDDQLAMSGDIFGHHDWDRSATNVQWVEANDAAKNSTMHKSYP